jgi:hypothetical protein
MGKYVKQTIAPGQTIASAWGNDVQTQFEKVVGVQNNEVTQVKAAVLPTDTRTVSVTRSNGQITGLSEKDGATSVVEYTFYRSGSVISDIEMEADGLVVSYGFNRTNGKITSITKGVS